MATNNPYQNSPREVVIIDIRMPFQSMVIFMVKWALASIPAMIILFIALIFIGMLLSSIGLSVVAFYNEFFKLP